MFITGSESDYSGKYLLKTSLFSQFLGEKVMRREERGERREGRGERREEKTNFSTRFDLTVNQSDLKPKPSGRRAVIKINVKISEVERLKKLPYTLVVFHCHGKLPRSRDYQNIG